MNASRDYYAFLRRILLAIFGWKGVAFQTPLGPNFL